MIAKIRNITPDGAPFSTVNGTFYPFMVVLDDGRSGQANSKSNPPPWRVGEVVGYEVGGQSPRGVEKLKIHRNPDPSKFGTYNGPLDSNADLEASTGAPPRVVSSTGTAPVAARSVAQIPPAAPSTHPATIGLAVKMAGDIMLAQSNEGDLFRQPGWDKTMREIASKIIGVSRSLETNAPIQDPNEPF